MEGKEHHCEYQELDPVADEAGRYCYVPTTHKATLGEMSRFIRSIQKSAENPSDPGNPQRIRLQRNYIRHICLICQKRRSFSAEDECG